MKLSQRNDDGTISVEHEYYAPAGEPGTGYGLDAFNFIAGSEGGGLWDEFDKRFQHVISRATEPYRFGDLSEAELLEAIARGYVKPMDYPLLASRDANGDWLVGKSGRETIRDTAIVAMMSVLYGAGFGELGPRSGPRSTSGVGRSWSGKAGHAPRSRVSLRLRTKLAKWKAYHKANPNGMSMKRRSAHTKSQPWGHGNPKSGFAKWFRGHGNRAGSQKAWLYRLQTKSGELRRWGVSEDPASRYTRIFMDANDLEVIPIRSGPREKASNVVDEFFGEAFSLG